MTNRLVFLSCSTNPRDQPLLLATCFKERWERNGRVAFMLFSGMQKSQRLLVEVVVRGNAPFDPQARVKGMTGYSVASTSIPRTRSRLVGPRLRRSALALLAATGSASVLSGFVLVPSVSAAHLKAHSSNSSASAFCAKMPASKVSSIVGSTVTLGEAVVQGAILVCLYDGSSTTVTLEKETGMAASGLSSLQKAEAGHKKLFYASQPNPLPKGTTISFSPLAALGSNAFYWTGVIEGTRYSGADAFKGTTGYFTEMRGPLEQSKVKQLEQLVLSA